MRASAGRGGRERMSEGMRANCGLRGYGAGELICIGWLAQDGTSDGVMQTGSWTGIKRLQAI